MSKLVLIDGNAIMHRAYHAMPALTTKDKKPAGAVYGFLNMLLRVVQDLTPTHIAVCFDRAEPTFRKEMFEDYQSQRPEMEDELGSQFELVSNMLDAMNIKVFSKAGYEADDLIGTLAHDCETKMEVVIVTGDKDILQLVSEKTKVYIPIRGLSNAKLFGEKDVVEKLGVKPFQVVDLKGLMGDASDNYPGVYGIGPKTAEKLLAEHGGFVEIYKNIDKVDKSTAKKLKDGREGGEMSYELAKIKTDVDFDYNLDVMDDWQLDSPEVLGYFDELGFKTPKTRVVKVAKEIEEAKQEQGSLF